MPTPSHTEALHHVETISYASETNVQRLHFTPLMAGIAPNLFAMEDKVPGRVGVGGVGWGRVCVGGGVWVGAGVWGIRPRNSPLPFRLGRQFPKYCSECCVRNHTLLIG